MLQQLELLEYFKQCDYDWTAYSEDVLDIVFNTKNYGDERKIGLRDPQFRCGHEQPFLLQSIINSIDAESYFEIGTALGCSVYSAAIMPTIRYAASVDIVPSNVPRGPSRYNKGKYSLDSCFSGLKKEVQKKISHKLDLRCVENTRSKDQSNWHEDYYKALTSDFGKKPEFDVCFIDGDHKNYEVLIKDYFLCKKLVRPGGYIIFDDYVDRQSYKVVEAVNHILKLENLPSEKRKASQIKPYGKLFHGEHDSNRLSREGENSLVILEM